MSTFSIVATGAVDMLHCLACEDESVVFLLSPAWCGGRRAQLLLRPGATLPMAARLQSGILTLGEAFTFMSGLYFRGKITYATKFGRVADPGVGPVHVITPTRGLLPPDTPASVDLLLEFASVDVDAADARYRAPLERDARGMARRLPADARVVLLGSVATGKYADVLSAAFGARLHYPTEFVGRGDMSRGGLLLRAAAGATELDYCVLDPARPRRGPRPPRLGPPPRLTAPPTGR
jgi:hypothetical protein